jgi:transcription elongation factor GreA
MEYLSEEGLEKLKQQLHELKTSRRKEIADRLEHAKSLGDLSENAEYQEAKEEQSLIESEIAKLEEIIRDAVLIKKDRSRDLVQVGSTVRVKSDRGEDTYTIVGSEEASPAEGKISNESPLGKAFLGHRAGDKVEARTPGGVLVYEIREIK